MSKLGEYVEYVLELLEPLGPIQPRRFFGGIGLYFDSLQFAFIMEQRLYFVVDEETRKQYEQAGMQPFSYLTKMRRVLVRKYFEVPEEVQAESESLQRWALEAIAAADKAKLAGKASPKRVPSEQLLH